MMRLLGLALLYLLASPVYALLGLGKLVRLWHTRQVLRRGVVRCIHCGEKNYLDILATCGRCHTTEYGNRLRCSVCGDVTTRFECDACGVTLQVL